MNHGKSQRRVLTWVRRDFYIILKHDDHRCINSCWRFLFGAGLYNVPPGVFCNLQNFSAPQFLNLKIHGLAENSSSPTPTISFSTPLLHIFVCSENFSLESRTAEKVFPFFSFHHSLHSKYGFSSFL